MTCPSSSLALESHPLLVQNHHLREQVSSFYACWTPYWKVSYRTSQYTCSMKWSTLLCYFPCKPLVGPCGYISNHQRWSFMLVWLCTCSRCFTINCITEKHIFIPSKLLWNLENPKQALDWSVTWTNWFIWNDLLNLVACWSSTNDILFILCTPLLQKLPFEY